jgi:hypothetical protein
MLFDRELAIMDKRFLFDPAHLQFSQVQPLVDDQVAGIGDSCFSQKTILMASDACTKRCI